MIQLVFLFALATGFAQGLECYQCGQFIPTSVAPCLNLTAGALQTCPSESTHCALYRNLGIVVYQCEKDCKNQTKWSFEIQCSDNYQFNGGTGVAAPSIVLGIWGGVIALLFVPGGFRQ